MIDLNALALVVVGGVIGVAGTLATFFLQRKHDRSRILSDKLEELLLSAELYVTSLNGIFLWHEAVMRGRLTIDEMNDLVIKENQSEVPPYTKLQTIVNLFFPELQEALSRVHAARSECFATFGIYRSQYMQVGHHEHSLIAPFRDAVGRFDVAADMLRQGIVSESNKITGVSSKYKSLSHYSREG